MPFEFLTSPRLRVLSAVSSNLAVVWLVALLAAEGWFSLTKDVILATLFLFLALRAEEILEEGLS